jgi:hypothetical protein
MVMPIVSNFVGERESMLLLHSNLTTQGHELMGLFRW